MSALRLACRQGVHVPSFLDIACRPLHFYKGLKACDLMQYFVVKLLCTHACMHTLLCACLPVWQQKLAAVLDHAVLLCVPACVAAEARCCAVRCSMHQREMELIVCTTLSLRSIIQAHCLTATLRMCSQVFLLRAYASTTCDGTCDALREGFGQQSDDDRRALETCRTLLTRRGLESTGAVPCVSAECGNWMVPEGDGQRVRCSSCLIEFCGR